MSDSNIQLEELRARVVEIVGQNSDIEAYLYVVKGFRTTCGLTFHSR